MIQLLHLMPVAAALVTDPTRIFSVVLCIILLVPLLLRSLRIPHVIGLILAGVLVGKYGLNILDRDSSFQLFGQVGIYYIMFLAGLELDMGSVQHYGRDGLKFGLFTFLIPFVLGLLTSYYLLGFGVLTSILLACIYSSHTLVTYPTVGRYGLGRHRVVVKSVVATAFALFVSLLVLAFVIGSLKPDTTYLTWMLFAVKCFTNISFDMRIPFSSFFNTGGTAYIVSLGILAIPIEIIAICGTVNGANFTDGLDGLAASVTAVITVFVTAASTVTNAGIAPASMAFLGCLLGFLVYNHHPAKVFMGDTGSLALGGFVSSAFIMMNMPIYLLIAAFIYFAEVLSVIIQVLYFRSTGGKRFFKMAPIHHHFELSGWSETKVVLIFTLTTVLLILAAFVAI